MTLLPAHVLSVNTERWGDDTTMATILADDPLTQSDAAGPAGQPDPWVIEPSSDADEALASSATPEPAPASDDEALPPQETADQGDQAPGEQEPPQAPPLP